LHITYTDADCIFDNLPILRIDIQLYVPVRLVDRPSQAVAMATDDNCLSVGVSVCVRLHDTDVNVTTCLWNTTHTTTQVSPSQPLRTLNRRINRY